MTVELTPRGVQCNLACTYCYQHPMRDAGNIGAEVPYDFGKMFAALEQENAPFTVFGGEALLTPLPDLIRIWEWGYEKWKQNGVQTNGVLITPEHISAFRKYAVHVGFSLDGPDELNDSRWAGTVQRTREATRKSFENLRACIAAGVSTSVIITLYRGNAVGDRLPRLKQWILELDQMGCRGIRIHLLEVDNPEVAAKMQLTPEENITALRELVALEKMLTRTYNIAEFPTRESAEHELLKLHKLEYPRAAIWERKDDQGAVTAYVLWHQGLELDILTDMRKLLRADDDSVTCTWNPCDPYTTSAVRGVDGQGNRSNCGRTNKDGIGRLKAEHHGYERQLALYHTPYENGGCKGCRFFLACKGQCPGTAVGGDWRNRTADCRVWFTLFQDLETEMMFAGEMPISLSAERAELEQTMLTLWERGQNMSLQQVLTRLRAGQQMPRNREQMSTAHGDSHGDHTDTGGSGHGDAPHGDTAHGDAHGDHTDQGLVRGQAPVRSGK